MTDPKLRERLQQAWDASATLPPILFTEHEADALIAALSPQTLPAPGEVERIRRAIWRFFSEQDEAAQSLSAFAFLGNRDDLLAQAIALATVAAANDEGEREEGYARGYRHAIDDAAKVAEDLTFGTEISEWLAMTKKDVSARACDECAAAIRLLSQGGGKARSEGWTEKGREWLDAGAPLATSRSQHEGASS
jgi:hypothetical protein